MEKLVIAGREFNSRLFLGTGKFNSNEVMEQSILASGTEMVTVAMKRIDMDNKEDDMLKHIIHPNIQLLPNTSGVRDAEEAVFAAQLAREAFGTNWLKLEIHPDPRYLLPDSIETLKATEELVKLGFVVLPYCQADPVLCKRLEEAWRSYRHAARCADWHEQRPANQRIPANHYRTGGYSRCSGCRYRCAKPCCRSDGTGSFCRIGEHGNRRCRKPGRDGKGFQSCHRSRKTGLRSGIRTAKPIIL